MFERQEGAGRVEEHRHAEEVELVEEVRLEVGSAAVGGVAG